MMKRTVRGLLWHQNCPFLEITGKPDKVFGDIGWQTAHGWDTWDKVNKSYETLIAPHFCQEVPHNCVIKGECKQNTTPWIALAGAVGIVEAHATNFPERVLERRELHRNMSLWGETSWSRAKNYQGAVNWRFPNSWVLTSQWQNFNAQGTLSLISRANPALV